MTNKYITLETLQREMDLKNLTPDIRMDVNKITVPEINRPALQLTGYYEHFANERVQIIGYVEFSWLQHLDEKTRASAYEKFLSHGVPCVIFTTSMKPGEDLLDLAHKYQVPTFATERTTSDFSAEIIRWMNVQLAPTISIHGVLVDVFGEGVLIMGESGIGKSEAALELIKRGHRLITDDVVQISRVSDVTLVGTSPDNIRHFLELRGIGIINTRRLFGMGAIKVSEKIDLIVELEPWDSTKIYDRMGVDNEYTAILGVKVPSLTIPIKPGRNLAVILEVAAMNNRQKKMGYNAAAELLENLGLQMDKKDKIKSWDNF